ncbi:MAG: hypothetical protein ABI557_07110 [Aureliella sp.]
MPAVHFAIAAIPVAVYFVLIGVLRLRTRPLVTTGWRDTLTLGIAASGLIALGPMQLFFPAQAAARWHTWVWLALFALYALGLMMLLLSCKPRLIAYGMDDTQFLDALLRAAQEVDEQAHWTGDVLSLPIARIQLAIEPSGTSRVHQVVLVGMLHNLSSWLELERAFVRCGSHTKCPRSNAGWPFTLAGLFLLSWAIIPLISDPDRAIAQLRDFLAP